MGQLNANDLFGYPTCFVLKESYMHGLGTCCLLITKFSGAGGGQGEYSFPPMGGED